MAGIISVNDKELNNFYVYGSYQNLRFGTQFLKEIVEIIGWGGYMDIPVNCGKELADCAKVIHVCEKAGFVMESCEDENYVRLKVM